MVLFLMYIHAVSLAKYAWMQMQVLVATSTMYIAYATWAIALFHQEKAFDMA